MYKFLSDVAGEFRKGLTKLPYTLVALGVAGYLIYLLAGTFTGNWIRCHLIDADACAPRIKVTIVSEDLTVQDLQKKENQYTMFLIDWPPLDNFRIAEYVLKIDNIGIQNLETVKLIPSVALNGGGVGHVLLYQVDGRPPAGASSKDLVDVTLGPSDFQSGYAWASKEGAIVRFIVAARQDGSQSVAPSLHAQVECPDCQVKFEKIRSP